MMEDEEWQKIIRMNYLIVLFYAIIPILSIISAYLTKSEYCIYIFILSSLIGIFIHYKTEKMMFWYGRR